MDWKRADGLAILGLALASLAMTIALWCKLQSLLYLDPSWWLQEIARVAHREVPYRDFGWHFPPLAVMLYGFALRIFGIHFAVVQVLMDAISFGIVFLSYSLLRHYSGALLAFLSCLLLIAICGTTLTYFSLFSLFGYSPALQTGAFGLLLLLNGVVSYIENGRFTAGRTAIIALGAFTALLSKPEPAVATVGVLFLVIVFDPTRGVSRWKWAQRSMLLLLTCFVPTLLVYGYFIQAAGVHIVAASVTGFGLGTKTCPYWPTGIGIWAMLAGLGAALVLVAIGSAGGQKAWRIYLGASRYVLSGIGAVIGFGVYLSYEIYARAPSLYHGSLSGRQLRELLFSMASTTDTFRAVLWPAILYWIYLLVRGLRQGGRLPEMELKQLIWFTAPVLMSARSLFSTVLSPFPEIPAMCYPFVILSGPYLLYRALIAPGKVQKNAALLLVAVLTIAYAALRIVGGYPGILSNRGYREINTTAGEIKVNDGGLSSGVYDYVMKQTSPEDGILEMPYGGGIGFASGRRSPLYSTLFVQISPPQSIQLSDVERIRRSPPAIVIARDQPNLGTYYGVDTPVGCEFPRIVWRSEKRVGDRDYVLPIVDFIRENYRVDREIGEWQLWRLRESE